MSAETSLLQDRLRDHSKALNGLLSLIPAKAYYGEDNSGQWNKKKQTKQEAAAARRGKLDPDSELNRNAKEVMDERAKNKRKLREMLREEDGNEDTPTSDDDDEPSAAIEGIESEKPGEGLRKKTAKKQKLDGNEEDKPGTSETPRKLSRKEEKRAAKRERKAQRKANKVKEPVASTNTTNTLSGAEPATALPGEKKKQNCKQNQSEATQTKVQSPLYPHGAPEQDVANDDASDQEILSSQKSSVERSESPSESERSPQTVDTGESTASNSSNSGEAASMTKLAIATTPPSKKQKHLQVPTDMTALRARLAAKIEALRAARKADGPDGKPIRTRQELIELRRAKQAQRKAHRKELWLQAKREEERKREEALASNSPGVMSPSVDLDDSTGNFSFGRVVFGDGSQMSHDFSRVLQQGKRKGPSDAKTALLKVQNQKKRLAELDAENQADITNKEAWLTARRRVEGDKIRDDEAILKKAVKRKEVAKKKSEKAWKERTQGVEKAQKERHKKRDENIKKRRDDRVTGKASKKKGGTNKKGGRPGFEGSFGVGRRRK